MSPLSSMRTVMGPGNKELAYLQGNAEPMRFPGIVWTWDHRENQDLSRVHNNLWEEIHSEVARIASDENDHQMRNFEAVAVFWLHTQHTHVHAYIHTDKIRCGHPLTSAFMGVRESL